MKALALMVGLLVALPAAAQEPAKAEPPKPRPALNLRLDDATSAAPRITFGQPPSTQTKDEREKSLPGLGADRQRSLERPINPNASGSPIPKAYDPAGNQ